MALIRELDSRIRKIRRSVKAAIDSETGEVDSAAVHQQTVELKDWIADMETAYIAEARDHPNDSEEICEAGKKLVEEAWFTYEVLVELSMKSDEPPPTLVKWEKLPSGVTPGKLKRQAMEQLDKVYEEFTTFRKEIIIS